MFSLCLFCVFSLGCCEFAYTYDIYRALGSKTNRLVSANEVSCVGKPASKIRVEWDVKPTLLSCGGG